MTLVAWGESHVTARWHSIVQAYAGPSCYGRDVTRLDELTSNNYLLSDGLRYYRGTPLFSDEVTANLVHMGNKPDVGFQVGPGYRLGRSDQSLVASCQFLKTSH